MSDTLIYERELLPWGNVNGLRIPKAAWMKAGLEPLKPLVIDVSAEGVFIRSTTKPQWEGTVVTHLGRLTRWGNSYGVQLTGVARLVPAFLPGEFLKIYASEYGLLVKKVVSKVKPSA